MGKTKILQVEIFLMVVVLIFGALVTNDLRKELRNTYKGLQNTHNICVDNSQNIAKGADALARLVSASIKTNEELSKSIIEVADISAGGFSSANKAIEILDKNIEDTDRNVDVVSEKFSILVGALTMTLSDTTHAHMELVKKVKNINSRVDKIPSNLLPILSKRITPSVVKVSVNLGVDDWGRQISWSGSGVFIEEDLILTAGHVVNFEHNKEHADPEYLYKVGPQVEVELVDGTKLKVIDVYMEDSNITDLGLIRVEWPDVSLLKVGFVKPKSISFGTSSVGEIVFAIGEPFGLFPSVTSGIVSALDVEDDDQFFGRVDLLQTDCPVNFGNSGCPLLNMKGEIIAIVIGMITDSDGISFCVPSEVCRVMVNKYHAIRALDTTE